MTLEKAIKILGDSCWDFIPEDELDIRDALTLGIEAMKRYKIIRANFGKLREDRLPGETKD